MRTERKECPNVQPHGVFNLNKPGGMTSREAVDRVQRILPRRTKVGHAGTLDPLASGVLVVCVGAATRLIEYVQKASKHYRATFLLGRTSETEDVEGEVTLLDDPPIPSRERLLVATKSFLGEIQQRPPVFSALKLAGRRAYSLARSGEQVDLAPRPVTIHRLEVKAYDYPKLTLEIVCGSGTYVRSLGRDLAESLGTGAVMSSLVRLAVGDFRLEEAVVPEALRRGTLRDHLQPPLRAVLCLPRITLSAEELVEIGHGRAFHPHASPPEGSELAALDAAGRLVAILAPYGESLLRPQKNLPQGDR